MEQEPYSEIHACVSGPGLEARLILRTPNSKDFYNLEECHFYDELKTFQYQSINGTTLGELYYLRDKIYDYCLSYNFVTYECKPALDLVVYDFRDRIKK